MPNSATAEAIRSLLHTFETEKSDLGVNSKSCAYVAARDLTDDEPSQEEIAQALCRLARAVHES